MSTIRDTLDRLGLSEYAGSLIAEGFDTWDTLTDITESDLNHLGVKLGHRRKLQRAITDHQHRYQMPTLSMSQTVNVRESHHNTNETNGVPTTKKTKVEEQQADGAVRMKRKYRRHPKADLSAPERPPSAYVLFSNYMRDSLKNKDYTFTEMAKVVGERWQELPSLERESFEGQATGAKERYLDQLAVYKKTDNYAHHMQYLADFKAKNNHDPGSRRTRLRSDTSNQSNFESPVATLTSQIQYSSDSRENSQEDLSEQLDDQLTNTRSLPDGFRPPHPLHSDSQVNSIPILPHSTARPAPQSPENHRSVSSSTIPGDSDPTTPTIKSYHTSRSPTPSKMLHDHIPRAVEYVAKGHTSNMTPASSSRHTPRQQGPTAPLHAIMHSSARSRRILPAPLPVYSDSTVPNSVVNTVLPDRLMPKRQAIQSKPESERSMRLPSLLLPGPLPERVSLPGVRCDTRGNSSIAVLLRAGEELAAQDEDMRGIRQTRTGADLSYSRLKGDAPMESR